MKIRDSFTLFILPFKLDLSGFAGLNKNSIWEPSCVSITDNFFFEHVREYLIGNLDSCKVKIDSALIYDLKDSFKATTLESSGDAINIFKKRHNIFSKSSDEKLEFKFLLQKKKLTSPKLLLFPLTSIGMIIFGIEVVGECSLSKLIDINYKLEKYNISGAATMEIPLNSQREEEIAQRDKILASLSAFDSNKGCDKTKWKFSQLINLLIFDLTKYNPILANSGRFHLFSYCQIDSQGEQEQAISSFGRIVRCQNENYNPVMIDYDGNQLVHQIFDNIFIGSCVEGAGIMVDTHTNSSLVLDQYRDHVLLGRYLWVYLLVYHQRLSLCRMTEQLSAINPLQRDSKDYLQELVSKLSMITVKTKFSNISDFTQHNTYYHFCMRNLGVYSYYDELKEKIESINSIIDEKSDKDTKRRTSRFEKLAMLLLIPQILFAYVTLHADIFGVQASSGSILPKLYDNELFSIVLLTILTIFFAPTIILLFILLKDTISKYKQR